MKKWISLIICILFIGAGSYFFLKEKNLTREEQLHHFIASELTSPLGGIYTNYLPTEQQADWATGHEVLSESIGLMMLVAYYDNDKVLFQQYSDYLDQYMTLSNGLYAWRILESDLETLSINATIDDLRIGKAYYLGYLKWADEDYLKFAQVISNSLIDNAVIHQQLRNYNNGDGLVDLSYLDIHTMTLYAAFDNRWQPVKRKAVEIVEGGYINDDFPFYHKVYDVDRQTYVIAETINMIDPLLVVLHLSEEDRVKPETMAWLKAQLEEETVYGNYRYGDWQPVEDGESTAVYALIMRIADNMNDESLYELAQFKAVAFQVTNQTSPLFGAFAFEETLEVYSFDQLQMLLALRRG